ncbi:MAG: serine/threonine-protein kinase [Phycisphaerales bacterium]|nr:serine/threonine-protein kinase [Phycisphaerales bacterium]
MVDDPKETIDFGDLGPTLADTSGAGGRASHRIVPGDRIGPFKILSVIGEGGFGIVFLAEQTEPVKRRVALKVIKAGMDTDMVVARFEAERQAVAMMNHPGIAKVFEAGATDQGRPYFVMEYVRGEPLSEYCDKQKLDTSERLDLFAKVCDAIQHAHQKGIIHRDLKPGNILVSVNNRDEPQPKVIDFGIAKATSQQLTEKTIFTQHGQMIGTPEYMSPEQAEMTGADIDTRSDVYSLGVILYELLSGKLPFDPKTLRSKGYSEIQRIIREEDPPRPSTRLTTVAGGDEEITRSIAMARQTTIDSLSSALRRELEWIPLKALRKDRTERYSSAEALAEDVRRYLRGDALEAGPETTTYRMRKFIRRNRAPFTVVASIALALVLGVIGTTIFAFEASRQRDEARAARIQAEERLEGLRTLIGDMTGSINLSVKNLEGGFKVRGLMFEAAEKQLDLLRAEAVASDDPLLLHAVGGALFSFGDLAGGDRVASESDPVRAEAYYRDAAELYALLRVRGDLPEEAWFEIQYMLPRIRNRQADLRILADEVDDALALIAEAAALLKPLAETGNVAARREYNLAFERRGDLEAARGDFASALRHYQSHLAEMETLLEEDPSNADFQRGLAMSLRRVGFSLGETGDRPRARESLERSVMLMRSVSERRPDDLRRRWDVGWSLFFLGQFLLESEDEAERVQGADHFVESSSRIVAVCVAEPDVPTYRQDVASLVPAIHASLEAAGYQRRAKDQLRSALLALQPVVESQPENIALQDLYRTLLDLGS